MFHWFALVDSVSETTRLSWLEVYNLAAIDFLSYASYVKIKRHKEKEEIEKLKNTKR